MKALAHGDPAARAAGGMRRRSGRAHRRRREKRAALDKWTRPADAACEQGQHGDREAGLAGRPRRPRPPDRPGHHRHRGGLEDDPRAEGAGRLARTRSSRSCRASRSSTRTMKRLSGATERFKIARLDKFLPKLGGSLQKVETAVEEARAARLRRRTTSTSSSRTRCGRRSSPSSSRSSTKKLLKRTKRLKANTPVSTPAAGRAKALRELSDIADTYARRLDDLKPPYWARKESDNYVVALRTLGRVFDAGAKALATPPITPAEGAALRARARARRHRRSARRSRSCTRASARSRRRPAAARTRRPPATTARSPPRRTGRAGRPGSRPAGRRRGA